MTTWHVNCVCVWGGDESCTKLTGTFVEYFILLVKLTLITSNELQRFLTYKWYFLIFNHNRWLGIVSQVKLSGNIIRPFFSSGFCILLKRNWWIHAECLRRSTCWSLQAPFVWTAQKLERLWNRFVQQVQKNDLITYTILLVSFLKRK